MIQAAMPWGAKNGERRPNWRTPWPLFREIERRYAHGGRFTVDVCADTENAKCARFITAEQDARVTPWGELGALEIAWFQPPFNGIGDLIRRIPLMLDEARIAQALGFFPARADQGWWHEIVLRHGRQIPLEGRCTFEPPPDFAGDVTGHAEPMALVSFERALYLPAFAYRAPAAVGVADLFAPHPTENSTADAPSTESAQ